MIQLVCSRGHVTDVEHEFPEGVAGYVGTCPKLVNGPAGSQVPCACRADWRRQRPEIKRA